MEYYKYLIKFSIDSISLYRFNVNTTMYDFSIELLNARNTNQKNIHTDDFKVWQKLVWSNTDYESK